MPARDAAILRTSPSRRQRSDGRGDVAARDPVAVCEGRRVWEPISIDEAAARFAGFGAPWWIAGGHAIELAVGRSLRPHGDLDVEILARDQARLADALPGWELAVAHGGELAPYRTPIAVGSGSLWARPRGRSAWALEILLSDSDGECWRYRRDARVIRALADTTTVTRGIPHAVPELVLLFKAKAPRPNDELDFDATVQGLAPAARGWLAEALATAHPGHPWIARLGERG